MRILIVSRTPWDNSNSFGNTFSNLFGGMHGVEIYNICCQEGINNNKVVKQAYQMTDMSVLKSVRGELPGYIMSEHNVEPDGPSVPAKLTKKRLTIFFIARDVIWKIGRWWNKDMQSFLDGIKPDVIYLPIYASCYMCDVQRKIVDYCHVPVVGHISDDLYSIPPKVWCQPLSSIYRLRVRKKVRDIIHRCSYVEVFAENMAREYGKIFIKPFYLIGKGIDISVVDMIHIDYPSSEPIIYLFTGNIGNGRYIELAKLAEVLDNVYPDGGAKLHIYTKSVLESGMERTFAKCKCLRLCGSVSSDEVLRIQKEADVLVHVEGFSEQSIFETKMSFSTKLIDYMLAGKVILAIGASAVNSIEVLRRYRLALTACTDNEIMDRVAELKNCQVDVNAIEKNVKEYLKVYRDLSKIQESIFLRMKGLLG